MENGQRSNEHSRNHPLIAFLIDKYRSLGKENPNKVANPVINLLFLLS